MESDRLTMVVRAMYMAAITVALYIRTAIYPTVPSRSDLEVRETEKDPYSGGRVIAH